MPSRRPDQTLRLSAAFVFLVALLAGFFLLEKEAQKVGYAAPPAAAGATHLTRTPTPTPMVTGVNPFGGSGASPQFTPEASGTVTVTSEPESVAAAGDSESGGLNPFLGFGASTMYALAWPDLCQQAVVTTDGEAWVISKQQFFLGDPNATNGLETTLIVQRCVGAFQQPVVVVPPTPVILVTPTAPTFSLQPITPLQPTLPEIALAPLTPVPWDRPPVLVPVFPVEPVIPTIPTLEAPEEWQVLPTTTVTLRTPGGQEIVLENPTAFRPDQWAYTFDATSETGDYTVIIESAGQRQERHVQVIGLPRLVITDRFTGQEAKDFGAADSAVLNYLDFQTNREVTVYLYRVVDLPAEEGFTQEALAPITNWRFTPQDRIVRETAISHLDPLEGPAFGTFVLLACYTDECNQLPRISLNSNRIDWPLMVMAHFFVEPSGQAVPIPAQVKQLRFAAGATSAVVDLTLAETRSEAYLFAANQGQTLHVEIASPNVQLYLLDARRELVFPDAVGVGVWEFTLPASGRYLLVLFGRENVPMFVEIPPPEVSGQPLLEDLVLARLADVAHRTQFPEQAKLFALHLMARLDQFQARGLSPDHMVEALAQEDAGVRITGIVQAIWSDWLRVAASNGVRPEAADPVLFGLSPFRQLVIRLIQDRQRTLSEAEQAALFSFLTRSESPDVWWNNPNGVIGALNREFWGR